MNPVITAISNRFLIEIVNDPSFLQGHTTKTGTLFRVPVLSCNMFYPASLRRTFQPSQISSYHLHQVVYLVSKLSYLI